MISIIVIDDCVSVLGYMKIKLKTDKTSVLTFSKPLEAMEVITNVIRPDVIVSDYVMFDIDGLNLIKQLKEADVKSKFIIFSSMDDPKLIDECTQNDISFYNKQTDKDLLIKDILCLA